MGVRGVAPDEVRPFLQPDFQSAMSNFYTQAQKALQARFEAVKLAAVMGKAVVHAELSGTEQAFIASRDMMFLASVDGTGQPTCSYKGGAPGFVQVVDSRTLRFPLYDGNGMFLSAGNIDEQGKVGMLFMDFEVPHRLRVQGSARLEFDAGALGEFPGADMVVRVNVDAVFVNCPRYVHKHQRVAASAYVPRADAVAPYPQWKRIDAFQSALVPRDAGKTTEAGGTLSIAEYGAKLASGEG